VPERDRDIHAPSSLKKRLGLGSIVPGEGWNEIKHSEVVRFVSAKNAGVRSAQTELQPNPAAIVRIIRTIEAFWYAAAPCRDWP
jgi:hypothetical protein